MSKKNRTARSHPMFGTHLKPRSRGIAIFLALTALTGSFSSCALAQTSYPAGRDKEEQNNGEMSVEALRAFMAQKLRQAMANVGIDNGEVQDALIDFLQEEEQGKRNVRQCAKKVMTGLRQGTPPEEMNELVAQYKGALEADKLRREQSQKALDARINYSKKPRLEAILLLMGVIGEGNFSLPAGLLNNQRGGPPGFGAPPRGPEPGGDGSNPFALNRNNPGSGAPLSGPLTRDARNNDGRPGTNPFGTAPRVASAANIPQNPGNANGGNASDGPATPGGGTAAAAGATTREGETDRASTRPNNRPPISSLRGTVLGTVDKKGTDWIEIKAEDGSVERYTPRWRGGSQGGFDPQMVQAIGRVGLGDKVKAEWEYGERKRLISLESLEADAQPAK